jgi:hypothetical protein
MGALLSVVLLGLSLVVLVRGTIPGRDARSGQRLSLALEALLSAGVTVYLVFYVVGEDDYRDNGISRWEAYDVHPVTVAAVVAGSAAAVVAVVAARGHRLSRLAGALGALSALLLGVAFIGNSLN